MPMALVSSSASGGSPWRNSSVRRTDPTSIEVTPRSSSSPSMNSVEPPPMSTTTRCSPADGRRRTAVGELALLARPLISSGRTPSACSAGRRTHRGCSRRGWRWSPRRCTRLTSWAPERLAVVGAAAPRCGRRPAGASMPVPSTPSPSRVRPISRGELVAVAVDDQQVGRVRTDVDRGDVHDGRPGFDACRRPSVRPGRRRPPGTRRSGRAGT